MSKSDDHKSGAKGRGVRRKRSARTTESTGRDLDVQRALRSQRDAYHAKFLESLTAREKITAERDELLAALEECADALAGGFDENTLEADKLALAKANAALAKAKGEA